MGLKSRGRKLIGVMMDPDLIEWLKEMAEERRIPMSQIVRELVFEKAKATGALKVTE